MSNELPKIDKAFIQRQRERLLKLREELAVTTRSEQADDAGLKSQSLGEAQEYEDDAQKLALQEIDDTVLTHTLQRLAAVERALKKIEDGTYGFSDTSGKPIALARLEAMPEAVNTVAEEAARDTNH